MEETMTKEDSDSERRVLSANEARQGFTPHVTRFVLVYGLGLVIVVFGIVYLVMSHKHP
jgi:hypothetical protein